MLPVTDEVANGYRNVIAHPMDLQTLDERLALGCYDAPGLAGAAAFRADVELIAKNALVFNTPQDRVYKDAWRFLRAATAAFARLLPMTTDAAHRADFERLRRLSASAGGDPGAAEALERSLAAAHLQVQRQAQAQQQAQQQQQQAQQQAQQQQAQQQQQQRRQPGGRAAQLDRGGAEGPASEGGMDTEGSLLSSSSSAAAFLGAGADGSSSSSSFAGAEAGAGAGAGPLPFAPSLAYAVSAAVGAPPPPGGAFAASGLDSRMRHAGGAAPDRTRPPPPPPQQQQQQQQQQALALDAEAMAALLPARNARLFGAGSAPEPAVIPRHPASR